MSAADNELHVRGVSVFTDDLAEPEGLLHAAVVPSPEAHGRLIGVDADRARSVAGVRDVITAAAVPGDNQIGAIIADEPLLADAEVVYQGEPVALVVAETERAARAAAALVRPVIDPLPPVVDAREAYRLGQLIEAPRSLSIGDTAGAWARCAVVVEGRADTGGQEHFYLETQAAMAAAGEGGRLHVWSSTQAPTTVQRAISRVLGLPMHRVEVEVTRLGGAFGGKEDQATAWAVMAALAALRTGRPVKLVLRRHEDMRMTGKRHPYSADYRLGMAADGRIVAYEALLYQNAGACADLSTAVLERSLFHATGSYFVPNARITAASCRTNLVPFTAFRGFGGPQAMFVIEAALAHAARALGRDRMEIQRLNLLDDGDELPYGMRAEASRARRCWDEADRAYGFAAAAARAREHNRENPLEKKGVAVMPVCFGISFTNTALNQGRALVHVHTDGSVSVSTGAVEMGQGVNEKLRRVAAATLGIEADRVRVESTSTARVASTSATAASAGADLNGRAVEIACEEIRRRVDAAAGRRLAADAGWQLKVQAAYAERVSLSEHAHYATPGIWFDKATGKGRPFAYHAYGTALVEATLDCLRGTYRIDSVRCVHDVGSSLAPDVDAAQIEGGIVQGIGWMTVEELVFDPRGRLTTDTTSTYKVPDIKSTPAVETRLLADAANPHAVRGSKAVGEPPLMYGIGAWFALADAMAAARPDRMPRFDAPLTPEKALLFLYSGEGD